MFDFMQPDSHQPKKKKLRSKAARKPSVMLLSTMFIFSSPLAAHAVPATQGTPQHKTQIATFPIRFVTQYDTACNGHTRKNLYRNCTVINISGGDTEFNRIA